MLNQRIAVPALAGFLFCMTISGSAQAAPFAVGDFITYSQDNWGTTGTAAAQLLNNSFDAVYPGGAEIGIIGPAGNSALFTSASAVFNFLPASGSPDVLFTDVQDPISTSAGMFAGLALALQFNTDFSDAGVLSGSAGIPFGDLVLVNLATFPNLNGLSVRQFLAVANTCVGGGSCPSAAAGFDINETAQLADDLSHAFEGGTPTQFAQDHFRIATAPTPVPEPATLGLLGFGIATLTMIRRFKRSG